MLKIIKKLLQFAGIKKKKDESFFDLPSREKKKILNEAVREANKDQLKLVKKYENRNGQDLNFKKC